MSIYVAAVAVAGVIVLAVACLETLRARRAARLVAGETGPPSAEPYILYFTGESCTVCKTHQEPALARLGDVRVDRVDAVEDRTMADRFHVYMLPTTVVMAADGSALHVNYGYAPAPKLARQLADARRSSLSTATA